MKNFFQTTLFNFLLSLNRQSKVLIVGLSDFFVCIISSAIALLLRFDRLPIETIFFWEFSLVAAVPIIVLMSLFGMYSELSRFISIKSTWRIAKISVIYCIGSLAVSLNFSNPEFPIAVTILQSVFIFLGLCLSRVLAGLLFGIFSIQNFGSPKEKLLIYGAGAAGRAVSQWLSRSVEIEVVGYCDDDPEFHGRKLNGVKIYPPAQLSYLARAGMITRVLIAIPSLERSRRNEILTCLEETHVRVATVPVMKDIVHGSLDSGLIRELEVEDLLGREPVTVNKKLVGKQVKNKVVMVTGAGGSIGSELCKQIMQLSPSKLILVDFSEYSLYAIHAELDEMKGLIDPDYRFQLIPILCSTADADRISKCVANWQPDTIYHTAAYKHVPLVQRNVIEGVRNNVLGTLFTIKAAVEAQTTAFVLVSTDKAVRPTNVMGASKRLAELILQAFQDLYPNTITMSVVRFGNVLESSGSVIPKFKQQISVGGPITLTHPDVERFFMTLSEAASLVLQASGLSKGGEIFLLDMGKSVRIIDLAKRLIRLSGLSERNIENPDGDIEIQICGLRPGEKLFEELLIAGAPESTEHTSIFKGDDTHMSWNELSTDIEKLCRAIDRDEVGSIMEILTANVTGFQVRKEL